MNLNKNFIVPDLRDTDFRETDSTSIAAEYPSSWTVANSVCREILEKVRGFHTSRLVLSSEISKAIENIIGKPIKKVNKIYLRISIITILP
jgi:hypothetical protein